VIYEVTSLFNLHWLQKKKKRKKNQNSKNPLTGLKIAQRIPHIDEKIG